MKSKVYRRKANLFELKYWLKENYPWLLIGCFIGTLVVGFAIGMTYIFIAYDTALEEIKVDKASCIESGGFRPCNEEQCAIEFNIDARIDYEVLLHERLQTCLAKEAIR